MAKQSPQVFKCAVIGAGGIATDHVAGFQAHPQAEVIAIADVSAERCNALADRFKVARRYTSTEDLLADKDIDVVGIALPNFLHAPVSIAALNAGKHVFLDKPFALNVGEARKVAALAKKKGRKLMLGMSHRFPAATQTLRSLVDDGVLGDVYTARAVWLRRSGIPKFGTWFCRKDQAGGGCLYDIGVHYLDKAMFSMNCYDVESVHGQVYTKFGNRKLGEGGWGKSDRGKHVFDVDDFALAMVRLKGGRTIHLNVSWAAHQATPNEEYVQLFGTEAGAIVDPLKLFRNGKDGHETIQYTLRPPAVSTNRHCHFIDTLLGKAAPLVTVDQALKVQATLDAIYTSSATGREVRLPKK
ncbi:MAG: Gfo/Idh/MocA family protein [Planctomycetota bacterium]